MTTTTNDLRLTATPIYPDTQTFPYVFVIREEDEDGFTAYGLRLIERPICSEECDFCEQTHPNAFIEHGAYGAPKVGVPVHTRCVLERGGLIARTEDVDLVTPEPPKEVAPPELDELQAKLPAGCQVSWAHTPSVYMVELPDSEDVVLLTKHHNWAGWEASCQTTNEDQHGIFDGPHAAAPPEDVIEWAACAVTFALRTITQKKWSER